MVRALASHRRVRFPDPFVTCGLSLLLVLVPARRVFLRVLRFFPLHKNPHSKFQFDLETVDKKSHLRECALLNPIIIITIIKKLLLLHLLIGTQTTTFITRWSFSCVVTKRDEVEVRTTQFKVIRELANIPPCD